MSVMVWPIEGGLVRGYLNMIKVAGIVVSLLSVVFFEGQTLDPFTAFYWICYSVIGVSSLTAFIVASFGGVNILRLVINATAFLLIVFAGIHLYEGYDNQWVRHSWWWFVSAIPFFWVVQTATSANDTETDACSSYYLYPVCEHRQAKYFAHFLWNYLPYLLGVFGAHVVYVLFGWTMLTRFVLTLCAILSAFCIIDEHLRQTRHWSFFWINRPVDSNRFR